MGVARFDRRFGDSEYLFYEMLKQRMKAMKPKQRQKKVVVPLEYYPSAIERTYSKQVVAWMKKMVEFVDARIDSDLETWIKGYEAIVKKDSFSDDIEGFEEEFSGEFDNEVDEEAAMEYITAIGNDVSDFQEKQWQRQVLAVLGTSFIVSESWEPEIIKNWSKTNYSLIKKLSNEHISRINYAVSNGIQSGKGVKEIKIDIQKINKEISGYRAQLIAQDQVGKLKSMIAKRRQKEIGLDLYAWVTAGDERVRKSHSSLDGMICKWEDSTVYSSDGIDFTERSGGMTKAEPGMDVRCRCNATPYFDELIEQINQELGAA